MDSSAAKGFFSVYSMAPEILYRVTSLGSVNQLLLHGGPLFEVWSVTDEDARTRVGIQGAVSLNLPLGGRFAGSVIGGRRRHTLAARGRPARPELRTARALAATIRCWTGLPVMSSLKV